jgi:hypothetical protein
MGLAAIVSIVGTAAAATINLGGAGGVEYRLTAREFDPPGTPKVTADCPGDKHVAGGAFVVYEPEGTGTFDYATSKPTNGGDGWQVEAKEITETAGVAATAMCADGPFRYRDKKAAVDPGYSEIGVSCGKGWHVTGGGASVRPVFNHIVFSGPYDSGDAGKSPDDGWHAKFYVDEFDQQPRVYAVCSHDEPAYRRVRETIDPGTGTRLTAECSPTTHLIGAAATFNGNSSPAGIRDLRTVDDPDDPGGAPDDGASSFGQVSPGAPAPDELTVFAICAR